MEKKTVLKIVGSVWDNASRDNREMSVVQKLGVNVLVMAKGNKSGERDVVNGFNVYRMSTRPLGRFVPTCINRIISLFTWAHQAKKIHADIISGHDLIGVQVGWMSNWFVKKKNKSKIIYDSHEFTVYNNGNRKQSWLKERLLILYERVLISKCVKVIEVTDSIADEVQNLHHLKERPIVVRNFPNYWSINREEIEKKKKYIYEKLKIESTQKGIFILCRHGYVVPGRQVEIIIDAVIRNENVYGVILGNGQEDYINSLKEKARTAGVEKRIFFHPAVPLNELYKYVGAADASYVGIENICKSYYYSLPNKFAESIQSCVPVICSDFPEMGKLCKKYEIGITVNPEKPNEIDMAIQKMMSDKEYLTRLKMNCIKAKEELCWEKEQWILEKMYREVL